VGGYIHGNTIASSTSTRGFRVSNPIVVQRYYKAPNEEKQEKSKPWS